MSNHTVAVLLGCLKDLYDVYKREREIQNMIDDPVLMREMAAEEYDACEEAERRRLNA